MIGDQLCGFYPPGLIGILVVELPMTWLSSLMIGVEMHYDDKSGAGFVHGCLKKKCCNARNTTRRRLRHRQPETAFPATSMSSS
jgi:hypothetical protein